MKEALEKMPAVGAEPSSHPPSCPQRGPGTRVKAQVMTSCVIQADRCFGNRILPEVCFNLSAFNQQRVHGHILITFHICSSLWPSYLHQELMEHTQQSHTSVATPHLGHLVNLKWFTRWYLKTFRDVIPGKELPQSYFKLLFIVKALLNFIFLQLFFRNSCLFYPENARISGCSLFPSHKLTHSPPGSSFPIVCGPVWPRVAGTHEKRPTPQRHCLQ